MRKSQFSILTDLNPGFGRPWDMLAIFFVNAIFIMFQKKSFGKNSFDQKTSFETVKKTVCE